MSDKDKERLVLAFVMSIFLLPILVLLSAGLTNAPVLTLSLIVVFAVLVYLVYKVQGWLE